MDWGEVRAMAREWSCPDLRVEHHVRVRDGVVVRNGDAGGGAPPA